jgi:tetratricopeptide (TPR) repeat protein
MGKLIQAATVAIMLTPVAVPAQDYQVGLQAFKSGDFERAIEEWKPLAEGGDPRSQLIVGWMYFKGIGVPQDLKETARLYHLAAAQRNAVAQQRLGFLYDQGLGVPVDHAEALNWYRLAAENGDEDAFAAYRLAAEQGEPEVQRHLGKMYFGALGAAPHDYSEAARWFRLAAAQGDAEAQYRLAWMYLNGFGATMDRVTAVAWYTIAAENGFMDAGKSRDILTSGMTTEDISEAQRRARGCMASNYQDCD